MMVFYAEQLASVQERLDNEEGPIPDPSLFQVLSWKLSLLVRTLLRVAPAPVHGSGGWNEIQ